MAEAIKIFRDTLLLSLKLLSVMPTNVMRRNDDAQRTNAGKQKINVSRIYFDLRNRMKSL